VALGKRGIQDINVTGGQDARVPAGVTGGQDACVPAGVTGGQDARVPADGSWSQRF